MGQRFDLFRIQDDVGRRQSIWYAQKLTSLIVKKELVLFIVFLFLSIALVALEVHLGDCDAKYSEGPYEKMQPFFFSTV